MNLEDFSKELEQRVTRIKELEAANEELKTANAKLFAGLEEAKAECYELKVANSNIFREHEELKDVQLPNLIEIAAKVDKLTTYEMLSVDKASKIFRVSRSTLNKLVRGGFIETRCGKIAANDVLKYLLTK